MQMQDMEEQREREVLRAVVLLHEFRAQLRYTLETKACCCAAWKLHM
jgi:hypothetical protein